MFFELCNTLNIFQVFINDVLCEYLDIFYFAYLNNIKEKYINYIKKILKKL